MVKKAQLATNVMDRLTQTVVIGGVVVAQSCDVKPLDKQRKKEHNTRKNKPTASKNVGVRRGNREWRRLED